MACIDIKTPNYVGLDHLRDFHRFGRQRKSVDTLLDLPYISKQHATIEWREPNWFIKDLSKNGIKLNGNPMPTNKAVVLSIDDHINFAGLDEASITILTLTPPTPLLINVEEPEQSIALSDFMFLPSELKPELALNRYARRDGWYTENLESGKEQGPFNHGDVLSFADSFWRLQLLVNDNATSDCSRDQNLDNTTFRFELGSDQNHAHMSVSQGAGNHTIDIELGEQPHHDLLLILLRHQNTKDIDASWLECDELATLMDTDELELNKLILESRKHIAAALPKVDVTKLIERRHTELRVGIRKFEIFVNGEQQQ